MSISKIGIFSQSGSPVNPPDPGDECVGTPLTGDADVYLRIPIAHYYTGEGKTLQMENLPEDDVFPFGQKMFVCGFNMSGNEQNCGNGGFTVSGSDYDVRNDKIKQYNDAALAAGLKFIPMLQRAYLGDREDFNSWTDTPAELDAAKAAVVTELDRIDAYANMHDNVYGYIYGLDDYRTRSGSNNTVAQNEIYQQISDHSKNLYGSQNGRVVSEAGFSYVYRMLYQYVNYLPKMDSTCGQNYLGGGDCVDEAAGYWKSRMALRKNTHRFKIASELLPNTNNGLPRLLASLTMSPAYAYSCVPGEGHKNDPEQTVRDYIAKEFAHDNLLMLMYEQNGLWIYHMKPTTITTNCAPPAYVGWGQDEIFKFLNKMTDYDVLKALLWGVDMTDAGDLTAITSEANRFYVGAAGGTDVNNSNYHPDDDELPPNDGRHFYPSSDMLMWKSIQYKGKRFIIATNSMPTDESLDFWDGTNTCSGANQYAGKITPPTDNVFTVRFDGLPTNGQIKITELIGTKANGFQPTDVTTAAGSLTVELDPLQSVVYMIEAADGYCPN